MNYMPYTFCCYKKQWILLQLESPVLMLRNCIVEFSELLCHFLTLLKWVYATETQILFNSFHAVTCKFTLKIDFKDTAKKFCLKFIPQNPSAGTCTKMKKLIKGKFSVCHKVYSRQLILKSMYSIHNDSNSLGLEWVRHIMQCLFLCFQKESVM